MKEKYPTYKLYIPKSIIVEYEEHPEPYGEYIVILENKMWTDAYTDQETGELYTITNDYRLIKYIKSVDPNIRIQPYKSNS
jgi:hypothetical protein